MQSSIIELTYSLLLLLALSVISGCKRQGRGKVSLPSKLRFTAVLFVAFFLTFCSMATAGITAPKASSRESVRVVMDDNYPPYTFRDSSGKLQGILVDYWALWEQRTGIQVQLDAMDWAKAQQRMEAGDYDVIDTIFTNEQRKTLYDFSAPYANIDVPLFFSRELSGIRVPKDLEGFVVGAKNGDSSIEILKASGVSNFLLFDNYEAIVTAARDGKIKVFTIDKPPAMYFLIKMGIQDQFRASEPLYSGEFHRAVRKGNTALLEDVQQGFNAISKGEYEEIDRHWYGAPILSKTRLTLVALIAGGALVLVCLLMLWVWLLRRSVRRRTAELQADITERRRVEVVLQHSEKKFRTLFEHLAEGVALHELVQDEVGKVLDYRILDVNPAYQLHTGLETASAPGRLGTEIYRTEVPPYLEEFSKVALGGEPYAFETFFLPLDKHFRISVISPRQGQFATVFEDITDRKRREVELKQKNAEMERFTYMISHDLKSPLVTVRTFLGYLELDMEKGKAERVAKDIGFIRDATGKMSRLLEDLLEVSRIGRVVNIPMEITLTVLLEEALKAVAGAISTRSVAILVTGPPIILFGDRLRLEEIWQNLIENAVKYMGDQSSPQIELGVEGLGTEAIFFVRDNGMGIDPRYHEKVFGLFEQLDAGSEGTGLGLALVKRIVELYEGHIWLESKGSGQGTCFRFTLPLALKVGKEGVRI